MLNTTYQHYALILLAGIAITFAYAPFSFWYIPFISLTLFFYLYCRYAQISRFWGGFAFGIGWFGAGISWVHVSIANFGGLPLIGSLGLMALLVGYLSLFPAIICWLLGKVNANRSLPLVMAALWFFFEWLRSWFLTGFPWLSLGYTQAQSPLAVWYPIIGETGVSSLLVAFTFYCGQCFNKISTPLNLKQVQPLLLIAGFLMLSSLSAAQWSFTTVTDEKVNVAMVQGNIKQELRWVPEQDGPTMQKYLTLTENLWHNDVVLWPEAAIPKLEPLSQEYLKELDQLAFDSNTGLITGIVNYNFETREAYNNLIALGKSSADSEAPQYDYLHNNRYAKHHLLPIGEFIPMEDWLRGLAPIFDLPMSSFSRGAYEQNNLMVNGYRFLPAICFEIAFPRQIAANLRPHTDFLLTVSNDAWFGDSHGPAQHLEIAQIRAAEFGLPLLRATNNGITAFIDHTGDIIAQAPQFSSVTLQTQLNLTKGMTPYRYWGDAPLWLLVVLISSFAFYRRHTDRVNAMHS